MKCTYFLQSQCRSCSLLEKSYSDTLQEKAEHLRGLFAGLSYDLLPAMAPDQIEGSRTKAKFSVFDKKGSMSFGLTDREGAHHELEHCPLHALGINELVPIIKDLLEKYKVPPYDLLQKKGELKYLIISKTTALGKEEFLVRFVLRSKESLDRLRKAAQDMIALTCNIAVVTANIQPVHQAILEGEEEIILTKQTRIVHQFEDLFLTLGARSFFQVTPEIALRLYGALGERMKLDRPDSVLDLYCGVGAFSFFARKSVKSVTGVEISKEAIACAQASLQLNNVEIDFIAEDAELYLKNNGKKFGAVIVNPPRRGLNKTILEKIKEISPEFIYYSSCNAETLRRDFEELKDQYNINSMQIFDMFPFTDHYETLMCLQKK